MDAVADFVHEVKKKRIFGPDLFQFYEGYFYNKYRLCIRVNLEIKEAENKGLGGKHKTRVCIEFALGNKH